MKHVRHLLVAALTVFLAAVLAVPAFAADATGSIKILSSENGTEYDFYRLFELTGQDTSSPADGTYDAITYTVASKWNTFFKTGAGAGYLIPEATATDAQKASLNRLNFDGSYYYINITETNVVAFTNAAMDYAIETPVARDANATGTGSDVTKSSLALGYYLMIPVDASIKTPQSSGSVASLTSTIPNAEIKVKAIKPGITKEDDAISVDVGQTVTYVIEGEVPNTAGYDTYKYIIKDEMSSGLTFNKDVKVELDGTDITSQVTIDYTAANKFSADIPVKSLQGENGANVGKTITLTYTAVVNDNAVTSSQEKNKATLQFGHNPSDLEESTPIEEEVYTAKIDIVKYTGDDAASGTKLPNAQFALMKLVTEKVDGQDVTTAKYYKYTAATDTTPAKVEWVAIEGAPTSGTANVTDAMAKALSDHVSSFTPKTTDTNGAAVFPGLADGTYYLVEFVAPDGYNRLAKPQEVTIAGTDADTVEGKQENVADATGQFDAAQNATATVKNNSGSELPETGGMGTTILYIVGGGMVIAGIVMFLTKRRMASVEK